jgi:hypothetical protein
MPCMAYTNRHCVSGAELFRIRFWVNQECNLQSWSMPLMTGLHHDLLQFHQVFHGALDLDLALHVRRGTVDFLIHDTSQNFR